MSLLPLLSFEHGAALPFVRSVARPRLFGICTPLQLPIQGDSSKKELVHSDYVVECSLLSKAEAKLQTEDELLLFADTVKPYVVGGARRPLRSTLGVWFGCHLVSVGGDGRDCSGIVLFCSANGASGGLCVGPSSCFVGLRYASGG